MRHPLLHLEADGRGQTTPYGGLALAQQLVRNLGSGIRHAPTSRRTASLRCGAP